MLEVDGRLVAAPHEVGHDAPVPGQIPDQDAIGAPPPHGAQPTRARDRRAGPARRPRPAAAAPRRRRAPTGGGGSGEIGGSNETAGDYPSWGVSPSTFISKYSLSANGPTAPSTTSRHRGDGCAFPDADAEFVIVSLGVDRQRDAARQSRLERFGLRGFEAPRVSDVMNDGHEHGVPSIRQHGRGSATPRCLPRTTPGPPIVEALRNPDERGHHPGAHTRLGTRRRRPAIFRRLEKGCPTTRDGTAPAPTPHPSTHGPGNVRGACSLICSPIRGSRSTSGSAPASGSSPCTEGSSPPPPRSPTRRRKQRRVAVQRGATRQPALAPARPSISRPTCRRSPVPRPRRRRRVAAWLLRPT